MLRSACVCIFVGFLAATSALRPDLDNLMRKSVNVSAKNDDKCREDIEHLLEALKKREEWALQMVDSATKFPSGLLTGNIIDLGNFDECLNANATNFAPKYCMVTFNLTNEISALFSLAYCVPDSCSPEFLEDVFMEILREGNVTVTSKECQTKAGRSPPTGVDIFGITVWGGFALLAVISTIYDLVCAFINRERNPWLLSFSLYTNSKRLLNTRISPKTMAPLNGLRFLSIAWIVLGHRYFYSRTLPTMNALEARKEFEEMYLQILIGGTFAVDTFFLLSGLLNSYHLLGVLDQMRTFPFFKFYIHRYFRLTPALSAIVLMYATWFIYIGTGPLWDKSVSLSRNLCIEHWWTALLYINNYYNPLSQCAGQTWYLAVDMQLYWLSPLVIIPIWKWPRITKYYLGFLLGLSTTGLFIIAYINKFRMAYSIWDDPIESSLNTKLLYTPTHARATPYIIGVILGVYLDRFRNCPEKPKWPTVIVVVGWAISTVTCLSVILGNYPFFRSVENHPYNRIESSLYISLHRIGWGIGISWIIVACLFGYGGAINSILSSRIFVPLSRLTYCIFLTHMAFQEYHVASVRTATYLQTYDKIHQFFGDLIYSILIAFVVSLIFEMPFAAIESLILRREKKTTDDLQAYTNKAFQEK